MLKGQEYTQLFQVTDKVYNGFIETFKDTNPLHTDDLFAKEKSFSGKVMHGNILNGFLSYFIGECLPQKNVIIQTQEIKYNLPVYLNDKLNFYAIVEDVFESVNTVEFKFYFSNENNKKVAKGKIQIGII
ncbi:MAG TPA: MaoC/PaaZ C-terminal domain-containing protein [Chitinophagales bacterium]|nr:MaoC/PaaZ C-terminal domain-containing protein [Chitinophagales bacterium]